MIRLFLKVSVFVAAAVAAGCAPQGGTVGAEEYADADMWYIGGAAATENNADVFYIAPTCNWVWEDGDGVTHHNMDVDDAGQRNNMLPSLRLAERVFADNNRFFSPYYRQATMETWFESDDVIEERFEPAMEDVAEAFGYYLTHFNGGRPFILAGHSQGAKCVVELLKGHLDDGTYARLVAAYAVGYEITEEELATSRYIVPAADSLDTGVTIGFNSVADISAIYPLFADNVVCINPMNWRTDATCSLPEENLGTVFLSDDGEPVETIAPVTAYIDTATHVLVVEGLDPSRYFIPSIEQVAPYGNYHVQEFNIYFGNLRHNVSRRVEEFIRNHAE